MRFRIDDVGASSKWYNQHGKKSLWYKKHRVFYFPFANIGFFKRIPPFRGWGVYDELTVSEWKDFLKLFKENNIVPIVAITATWVEEDGRLTPFPEKFPEEALFLKEAAENKEIIIANHGLTHCIIGSHLPRFWSSNRSFHREFYPKFDEKYHEEHIKRSQEVLEDFFEIPVTVFVPPGNVWSAKTYEALKKTNIKEVISKAYMQDSKMEMTDIKFTDDRKDMFSFHDLELKRYGAKWLEEKISLYK